MSKKAEKFLPRIDIRTPIVAAELRTNRAPPSSAAAVHRALAVRLPMRTGFVTAARSTAEPA